MPLTKVRYDMLDPEVTDKIKDAVTVSGAGSPLIFDAVGDKETLSKFKVNGVDKTIRSASFNANGLLEIELATFTPVIDAAGQGTLPWDVPATYFTVSADNPTDFTAEWISGIKSPIVQTSGSVSTALSAYTLSGASLPLTASGDFTATYTVDSGYIRPVHNDVNGTATGGSASGTVTFIDAGTGNNADWGTTKTWSTSWENVSHSIAHAALSGSSFLKTYASTAVTLTVNGLSDPTKASCTLTPTGGTISGFTSGASGDRSAQLDFTVPICKDNTASNRSVSLATTFNRPVDVTGTAYSYTPAAATTASTVTASFTYPSFTTWTSGPSTLPAYADLVDASKTNGFTDSTTVIPFMLGDEATGMSQRAVVNTGATRTFWFCVRANHSTKPTILTGDGTLMVAVQPGDITEGTIGLRPVSTPTGWTTDENYKVWGISLNNGTTYVKIN